MRDVTKLKSREYINTEKIGMIMQLSRIGFQFGGVVNDTSIKGPVDFNMIYLDKAGCGYEIKARRKQFCLYELYKGKSKKGIWYRYDQINFTEDFFEIIDGYEEFLESFENEESSKQTEQGEN